MIGRSGIFGKGVSSSPLRGLFLSCVAACVPLVFLSSPAVSQEKANPQMEQLVQTAIVEAYKLYNAGKLVESYALCEEFLRQHPDCGVPGRRIIYFMDGVYHDTRDMEWRKKTVTQDYAQFGNVPLYFTFCAARVVQFNAWTDPAHAVSVADEALKKLGDNFPTDHIGADLLVFRLYAVHNLKKSGEVLETAPGYTERVPLLLSNLDFLNLLSLCAKDMRKSEEMVGVAKLALALCDFSAEPVNRATTLVLQSLSATEGQGVSIQFAKSQEDSKIGNPLKHAAFYKLGDGEKMLAAAKDDPVARLNALLYLGRIREALAISKDRMGSSRDPSGLSLALKDIARCFKAKDLSLLRANRFLEFHRTGEGDNPLKELEAELAKGGGQ